MRTAVTCWRLESHIAGGTAQVLYALRRGRPLGGPFGSAKGNHERLGKEPPVPIERAQYPGPVARPRSGAVGKTFARIASISS
jgi:hypothetical protein